LAARDAALRERLAPLQRRHQEMTARRSSGPAESAAPAAEPAAPPAVPRQGNSGIFRRIFG
jgi:hypothetical protein